MSKPTQITAKVAHTPILYNGKYYNIGDLITLDEAAYHQQQYYLSEPLSSDAIAKQEAAAIADTLDKQAEEETEKTETVEPKPKKAKGNG